MESLEQPLRPLRERAAQLGIARQLFFKVAQPGFPLVPTCVDVGQVPGEGFWDLLASPRPRIDRSFGSHDAILVDFGDPNLYVE